jgi:hypothetical protein
MIRPSSAALGLVAAIALVVGACNSTPPGPALTDPKEILTAALKSTEAAKSVHLDVTVDGKATVKLPNTTGAGTTVDLAGTTASADIDFTKPAARAIFSAKVAGLTVAGEIIAIDGKTYTKTTLTGPLYTESAASAAPVDPSNVGGLMDDFGDVLLKDAGALVKGDDVACGNGQCYTVSTTLSPEDLGLSGPGAGALAGLPIDLTGATVKVIVAVEKSLPYHLYSVTAVLTTPDGNAVTAVATASKWDQPVTVAAPSPDQVKPAS